MKEICVIIPVFNALKETKACIKSILRNFDFKRGNVIIADDCSNIQTEKFLKKICSKYPEKLTLIRNNNNLGYLKNCNNAVTKTNAEIVVLLNSDCEIPPNFTDKIFKCFNSAPDIITASPIASNSATYFIPQILPLKLMNNILSKRKATYPEVFNSEGFCFCIRKSFIDKYGLFDEIYDKGYFEEVDFCFKVRQSNKKCVLIDDLYVKHKRNKSFGIKRQELMIRNKKIFYDRWKYFINQLELMDIKPFKEIIQEEFGIFSFIPLNIIKIYNIFTKPNRLYTLKNLFTKIQTPEDRKKIIYTCISGQCDFMPVIQTYYAKDWHYVCFTNNKKLLAMKRLGMWEIHKMQFNKLDDTKNARWHKLHPDDLFPDSTESLWIDANLDILTDQLFKTINNKNSIMLIPKHNLRDCVFEEIKVLRKKRKENNDVLEKIKDYLIKNNMPENYGLNETNILYRKHHNPIIKKIMNEWWEMIENYSKRDQLSLSFILWHNKINVKDISIENTRTDMENFKIYTHNLPNTFGGKILKLLFY